MKALRWKIWIALVLASAATTALAQSGKSAPQSRSAPRAPHITRFFIARPPAGSAYETGPLHILYSDGTGVVQTLPSLKPSSPTHTVFNAVGFSRVALASDRQTLGWTVDVQNCCTSYPIPLTLVVFRHKHRLHTFQQGQMVWNWMFLKGGKEVAAVWGPTHGTDIGDYRLYDVQTGKLLSEVLGDTTISKPNAPAWVKQLQARFSHSIPGR